MEKKLYSPKGDPQFQDPFIDVKEERKRILADGRELTYVYIHGGFRGTNVKFVFDFPVKGQYQGRFFQHLSPFPGPDEELASQEKTGEEDNVAFALYHGACFVETNMGSGAVFGSEQDSTIFYRSSAAAAQYCRETAQRLYGTHRVYGYVFGGSGGGYKTMSCIENTDVWDGAVPFVIGSPVSLPNCLTVYVHGSRLLRNAWPKIVDALEPGGSGDMYGGLTLVEKDALREITRMGFPPRMCYTFASQDDGALPVLAPTVHRMDPSYFTDFWTKPGYLGTEPDSSAVRDRILLRTKVTGAGLLKRAVKQAGEEQDGMVRACGQESEEQKQEGFAVDDRNGVDNAWQKMLTDGSDAYLMLEEVPEGDDLYLCGVSMTFESGRAVGKRLSLGRIEGKKVILGMCFGTDDPRDVLTMVRPGDEIVLDNSDYIAIQTYHRHQIPEEPGFTAWDQYKDENGVPKYPQREQVISYGFTQGGCGSVQDGHIQGKVIVMNNLMDGDFPWQADWYRRKVEQVHGGSANDRFRIWYNDNCPHGDVPSTEDELRVTGYLGMLHQALLDVSAWVEQGIEPPQNSGYKLVDSQVMLAEHAAERSGIQPVVTLSADGKSCARIKAGETVTFRALAEIPPRGGTCTCVEWSFEGEPDYPVKSMPEDEWEQGEIRYALAQAQHTYVQPGTYFAVVRMSANRCPEDPYTVTKNLCRVRIIVEN